MRQKIGCRSGKPIEFKITILRHEGLVPKSIPSLGGGSDQETKGAVRNVTRMVRLVFGHTTLEEMQLTTLELISKEIMATHARREIDTLPKVAELGAQKSITVRIGVKGCAISTDRTARTFIQTMPRSSRLNGLVAVGRTSG